MYSDCPNSFILRHFPLAALHSPSDAKVLRHIEKDIEKAYDGHAKVQIRQVSKLAKRQIDCRLSFLLEVTIAEFSVIDANFCVHSAECLGGIGRYQI